MVQPSTSTSRLRSAGSARSVGSTRSVGSAPFVLPSVPSKASVADKPLPQLLATNADARDFHPMTSPLDFEAWPWKAARPEKRPAIGPLPPAKRPK